MVSNAYFFFPLSFLLLLNLFLVFPTVTADVRIAEPHPQGGFMRAAHRAAAFGPRIQPNDVLSGPFIPFEVLQRPQKYGCRPFPLPPMMKRHDVATNGEKPWIALILRGHCPFEQKVRTAMQMGNIIFFRLFFSLVCAPLYRITNGR